VRQRGLSQASLGQPLRIASSWASLSGESRLYLAIDRHPDARARWPFFYTQGCREAPEAASDL
jgi:hypothetical protein